MVVVWGVIFKFFHYASVFSACFLVQQRLRLDQSYWHVTLSSISTEHSEVCWKGLWAGFRSLTCHSGLAKLGCATLSLLLSFTTQKGGLD